MNVRDIISLVEVAQEHKIKVRGKQVFIDNTLIGEIAGGRWRKNGEITPSSGYYLRLTNGMCMYRREPTDKHPWRSGMLPYAEDVIKQVQWDADDILITLANPELPIIDPR